MEFLYQVTMRSHYSTAVFLGSTAFVFLNFGLPVRADEMGLDAVAIGATYTVFTGTLLLLRPLIGYALDHFGRRWFFSAAFVFYTLAMYVFAHLDSGSDFFVARFLQGIGAALMWVSARTIVADVSDAANYSAEMGGLTASSVRGSMIGAVYGFTLLGFMPMAAAWQWAFGGYAVAALGALLWSLWKVPESRPPPVHGASGGAPAWQAPAGLGKLMVIVFLTGFATALVEPVYLLMLRHKFDVEPRVLAAVFLPAGLVFAILPRYAGRLADRSRKSWLIATGVGFAALVTATLPFWPSLVYVAVAYILFAVGWALATPALDGLLASMAAAPQRGRVVGRKEAAAGLGAALGPLAGGALYEHVAIASAFLVNGAILVVAATLTLVWFRQR